MHDSILHCITVHYSVYCSVSQYVAEYYSVLQQCVAVYCCVLQFAAYGNLRSYWRVCSSACDIYKLMSVYVSQSVGICPVTLLLAIILIIPTWYPSSPIILIITGIHEVQINLTALRFLILLAVSQYQVTLNGFYFAPLITSRELHYTRLLRICPAPYPMSTTKWLSRAENERSTGWRGPSSLLQDVLTRFQPLHELYQEHWGQN